MLLPLFLSFLSTSPTAVASGEAPRVRECVAPAGEGCAAVPRPSSVYVIGDIHGDAICAVSWVDRTGLIANLLLPLPLPPDDDGDGGVGSGSGSGSSSSSSSYPPPAAARPLYERLNDIGEWRWTDPDATIVFMGDYVDKGPTARQTVEFVRNLTIAFPDKVAAILGNHELELLRDRDPRIPPVERYSAYSYATVHPGDYRNYVRGAGGGGAGAAAGARDLDDKDDLVLDLLYEANMEVYAHRAHSAVRVVPSLPVDANPRSGVRYAITDIMPPEHRPLAVERLAEYQDAYLNTFRSGTPLGSWLERRPIVHLDEGVKTMFVHGGVSHDVGREHFAGGREGVDRINSLWWENSSEGRLLDFLRGAGEDDDGMGDVVYELLTYRGNHPGYANWESHGTFDEDTDDDYEVCGTLHSMLGGMDGIDRIAVGHTPEEEVRVLCDGKFLALDSTLGRWIRGTGNEYCPGPEHFDNRRGVDVPRTSRNGKYTCDEVKEVCEGQIVRLDSDGSVNILTM
jgi:hypothetical protein